ncbi:MAG TPA: transglycosylase SLT domain-containing protein [Steroidobacteraceae bacterium]|nr:transglycosylase SLT domain-containing protein [Steroidobacteraceae bacterium]
MNSTRGPSASRGWWGWLWAMLLLPLVSARAPAADTALPYPPQLQRDVSFWVRVYTQIDTNSGYLHDQYNLAVVYDTLHFAPYSSPRARQRMVNGARDHFVAELRRIASGKGPLTPEDERIKALWGAEGTPERLLEATDDIRFQLGQSNRFKAGLIRSGAWQQDIAHALRDEGLPPELAALPLVESSYNPRAYSKVGAAGLWQFMPSTGRRFMRIDRAVDNRMDPFAATDAAAQLLAYNHRILGTWPLALTAYNHGVAGMRRAVETLGTTNIVTIVRNYQSRTFGFASRNFYVSFLAALKIDRDPQKYFGAIVPLREERFREVRVPAYVAIRPLERALAIDSETLHDLNPALRPAVWRGRRAVPRGYELRLPLDTPTLTTAMLAKRLGSQALLASTASPRAASGRSPLVATGARLVAAVMKPAHATAAAPAVASATPVVASANPSYYSRVALAASPAMSSATPASSIAARTSDFEGDSLPESAARFGMGSQRLLDFNQRIGGAVPETGGEPDSRLMTSPRAGASPPGSGDESAGDDEGEQPVSAAEADEVSPSLGPSDGSSQSADPTDYSVARNGTIEVAAAETLGHYADWLGVRAADLRRINHMRFRRPVIVGHRIRLDFRRVPPGEFEARRREYHQALEASYFAAHRIVGTEQYVAQSGDSLWTLTQRFAQLPLWLLREYNPDTDFADLRPGTQLVVPRIEEVSASGD